MSTAVQNTYEVKAGLAEIDEFTVTGVSIVTDHKKATDDINALWERFFEQSVGQHVQGKIDDTIYAVYSDYEGDYTKPYRLTIGYRVEDGTPEQSDFHAIRCISGTYALMSAAGQQPKALLEAWEAIWSSDLERTYATDFEVYGPRFFEEGVHEVLIHVGVKP